MRIVLSHVQLRVLWFCLLASLAGPLAAATPAVALYYGATPPWDELRAFDVVVVEPDHPGIDPKRRRHADSELFAYVSIGEVHPSRAYYRQLPSQWLIGRNAEWGSRIVNQAQPGWPDFFVEKVVAPLWARGYRGFFLDTLDSYQRVARNDAQRARQEAGLVAAIRAVRARFPEAKLILNRGFEILPQVREHVWMVAAESLYRSHVPGQGGYREVPEPEREGLLAQLQRVRREFGLPVLVIDYVPPEARALARETAAAIRAQGFIPWVATPALDTLGIGNVEVLPRRVLVLYDGEGVKDVQESEPQVLLGFIFAYLGLVPEYRALGEAPPQGTAIGRYAGVVAWLERDNALLPTAWPDWLLEQVQAGLPLAVFGSFGMGSDASRLQALGLVAPEVPENATLQLAGKDALMGFEMPVRARSDIAPLRLTGEGRPLVTLQARNVGALHPAALTPWGGYVATPYVLEVLPGEESRWLVNPLEFLRAALKLDPSVPVPDVTTENGRRLVFVHIDGDGFASAAERRGPRAYAGEVMRDEILKRYRYPTTTSVVEGETGTKGLYPKLSPRLEKAARDIFALPWVEVATHTYSHPFFWHEAEAVSGTTKGSGEVHLGIEGYRFSLAREIAGSRDYINARLTTPAKPVKVVLWTGDCTPSSNALATADEAGLLNMNGGDTTITRRFTSWTRIAGLGVEKNGRFQVFAPNQNENVYTNDWTGPFYGFDRVIETFEMTDRPYRFKPVNLYYHFYSASKEASLQALHRIYGWIDRQPLHPVWGSDYIRKVLDYNRMVVARTPEGFRIRGGGELRTLRVSRADWEPDLAASRHLAGIAPAPEGRYLNLANGSADLVRSQRRSSLPYLAEANARLTTFSRRSEGLRFGLAGQAPLQFALGAAASCALKTGGRVLAPQRREAGLTHYRLEARDASDLELDCKT